MNQITLFILNDIQEFVDKMKSYVKSMIAQERKHLRETMNRISEHHTRLAKMSAKPVHKQMRHHINNRNRTWNRIKSSTHAPALNIILMVVIFC